MSLIPSFFGRRTNVFDPLSLDIFYPFSLDGFFSPVCNMPSAFVNVRIDWKETPEAHVGTSEGGSRGRESPPD